MPKLSQQQVDEGRQLILNKVSYAKAAAKLGVKQIDLFNALQNDPIINNARDAGLLNKPKNTSRRVDYAALPWVVDVLQGGMSQVEAAKVHGKSQPYVSKCVRIAAEERRKSEEKWQKVADARAAASADPTDPEIDAIHALIKAYASRRNLSTKQVLHLLDK